MSSPIDDGPLLGGTANHGRVVRVGDTVHRPVGVHTDAVHALLDHLGAAGFGRAPRVLGRDDQKEIVGYLPGTAGIDPIPSWALQEKAIAGVGALLRDYHDHAAGFDPSGLRWQRAVPARWRGNLVTHNDLNPANVIFRDGDPVGMIDFDLASPGCAAFDLAVTACFWVPLLDASDIEDSRRGHVVDRLRALLDGYRADRLLRREVVVATPAANRWIASVIEDNARLGHPAFGRLWRQAMGVHRRASTWLTSHTDELLVASR
jgi:phosphotransferase family enzyme